VCVCVCVCVRVCMRVCEKERDCVCHSDVHMGVYRYGSAAKMAS